MSELLKALSSPWNFLWVVIVFGLAPGLCLRLIVLAYSRDNPRRAELIAELYGVPRIKRPLWVAEQIEVALFEGLAHRVSAALRRFMGRHRTRRRTVWSDLTVDRWFWLGLLVMVGGEGLMLVEVYPGGSVLASPAALVGASGMAVGLLTHVPPGVAAATELA
jgi:hypothetical protein